MALKILLICLLTVAIVGAYQYSIPYPFTVNSLKRSANALNRLILQSRRHKEEPGPTEDHGRKMHTALGIGAHEALLSEINELIEDQKDYNTNHMERRGPKPDQRTFSRCYFNVVSCFK